MARTTTATTMTADDDLDLELDEHDDLGCVADVAVAEKRHQ